jgi:hypothetical protein
MNTPDASARAWALIENEKRRDRFIRRVNIAAWVTTLVIVLLVGVMTGISVFEMAKAQMMGAVPWMTVMASVMPLVDVLWKLSLLVATLSTVAMFFRLRTASLAEIQLRLAALEELLASKPDTSQR